MFSLSLESKGPVLDWDLHIDSIVGPKDILEIFAWVENVNTDASIKAGGLEQPKILTLMLRRPHTDMRSYTFVVHELNALKFLVEFSWR